VRARFGADLAARTSVINNGYHPRRVTERPAEGSFEIAYAGALYGGRRLELIATAVRRLLDEGIIRRGAFKFHIFGDTRPENQVTLAELGVQDLFEEHGFVPFEKLMRRLEGMNALALMIADNMAYSISYKFYDYLSLRRPVLAIAPAASQIEKTVERYDCGVFADIHEPFSIYRAIRELATDRRKFNFESVEEFTWENLSQRYVNLIEETLRESNASRGS
jgi:glycosyltransferase involved in cell wall biosynthesis